MASMMFDWTEYALAYAWMVVGAVTLIAVILIVEWAKRKLNARSTD
jgi:hypothetical protein